MMLFIFIGFPLYGIAAEDTGELLENYQNYRKRFEDITAKPNISQNGFQIIEEQVFPIELENFGEVYFVPALDNETKRMALFIIEEDGSVVYKTDQLETNYRNRGELVQLNKGIAAVSFQDVNEDGLLDIVLITFCENVVGDYAGKTYKIGDVLFQNKQGFYRDWRLSDKINRFSMNKSIEFITSFVRDGESTEFLYTVTTLDELLEEGFEIITEQCYWRRFEKLGRLKVIPGTYSIADYNVFMVYLVNDQGYIVYSYQPMGNYDNLYALKGLNCDDIDGDGLKDMVILARYSYENAVGELIVESDYFVYYQRTGRFYEETDYENIYQCNEKDTMSGLKEKLREYWGWGTE